LRLRGAKKALLDLATTQVAVAVAAEDTATGPATTTAVLGVATVTVVVVLVHTIVVGPGVGVCIATVRGMVIEAVDMRNVAVGMVQVGDTPTAAVIVAVDMARGAMVTEEVMLHVMAAIAERLQVVVPPLRLHTLNALVLAMVEVPRMPALLATIVELV